MVDDDDDNVVHDEIERRAYQRFCDRGSQHGADLDDWLAAEHEILAAKGATNADRAQRAHPDPRPHRRRAARS